MNEYWKIDAETNGYQILIWGTPADVQDENDPAYHNCDAMGCPSVGGHIVAIIPLSQDYNLEKTTKLYPKYLKLNEGLEVNITQEQWDRLIEERKRLTGTSYHSTVAISEEQYIRFCEREERGSNERT